jgi:hypothetical protein
MMTRAAPNLKLQHKLLQAFILMMLSFHLILIGLTVVVAYTPVLVKIRHSSVTIFSKRDANDMRIDESTLSESERQRLAFIQKLTNEADEFAAKAGFNVNVEAEEREVIDTKWSGQSDVESVRVSRKSWADALARPGLLISDILALTTFAAIGRSNHGEGLDVTEVLVTAAPFILAWVVFSPLLGSYSRKATASIKQIPVELIVPWIVSTPIALALRGLLRNTVPPTPFIIVSMIATLAILSISRVIYINLTGETSDEEYRKAGSLEIFKMIGTLLRRW